MINPADSFGYLNTSIQAENPLISHSLAKQLGSGQTRIAFSGLLYIMDQDHIQKQLGKCIFAIKRNASHNAHFYISILKYNGEEVTSKQIDMFASYQINEIVGEIKWANSLILSNVYRFSFDRQEAVILISIAMEQSITQIQSKESHPISITYKIERLEKELDLSDIEKERLSKFTKRERLERLERLWRLQKMEILSRDDKFMTPLKDSSKRIKKSTSKKPSQRISVRASKSKEQERIQEIMEAERGTPYQIIEQTNEACKELMEVEENCSDIEVEKKKRKSTGSSKLLDQLPEILIPHLSSEENQGQFQILAECKDEKMRQEYEQYENRKNFRTFYQGRHGNKLYNFIEDIMIVKHIGKNNTFLKKTTLSNLLDRKSKQVKPTKTICFSFDEKVMILAVTGRLYLADTHKGKISYEVDLDDEVVFDFCLNKVTNQKEGYDTFLAVTHNNVYAIDTWAKTRKLLTTNENRPQRSFFRSITCLPNGNYAVGFDNGMIEILSHKDNSRLLVFTEKTSPVLFLESSNDGMFLLVTDEQSIMLFPADKKRFLEVYKKKPVIRNLCLKSSFLEYVNKRIHYETIPARFNEVSIGKQESIVWAYANFVLIWSLKNIIDGPLEYKMISASHIVTHVEFKYNDPSKIFIGTVKDLTINQTPGK